MKLKIRLKYIHQIQNTKLYLNQFTINDNDPLWVKLLYSESPNYFEIHDEYKKYKSERVKIMPFITEMDQLYAAADIVITRSGAATLSELCCAATPALLIPSPNVAGNPQYFNAKALADNGAAYVIKEKDLAY